MNDTLLTVLSLTVSGSLLALLLFLLQPVLKRHASKTWQYYLFAIVILRLLLAFSSEHSLMNMLAGNALSYSAGAQETGDATSGEPVAVDPQVLDILNRELPAADRQEEYEPGAVTRMFAFSDLWRWGWLVWLVPAAFLFLRKLMGYHRIIRAAKAGCGQVESEAANHLYSEVCAALKIRRPPALAYHPGLPAPVLLGALHPVIALPDTGLDHQQLRYIFCHELTHYKRLDIVYKWLVQAAICIHWFNPLVYPVSRAINRLCELSCDEAVICRLDREGMRAYGEMLLDSIKNGGSVQSRTVVSITLYEDKKLVKERLTAIMSYRKRSRAATAFSATLAAILLAGASFTGAYAAGNPAPVVLAKEGDSIAEPMPNDLPSRISAPSGVNGEIIKTLAGDGIQNIDIYAELCTLVLEKSQSDRFEVQLSFPEITRRNYEKHFELRVKKRGSTIAISTDYEGGRWDTSFETISGFDDQQYPFVTVLTVKVPEKQYDALGLTLFSVGSTLEIDGIDVATLNIYNGTGNVFVNTDRAYPNLQFDNHVGNVVLQMPELGDRLHITNQVGNFVLSLPTEPENVDIAVQDASGSGYDVVFIHPDHWTPDRSGGEITYRRGTARNNIYVGLGQHSQFAIQIPQTVAKIPPAAPAVEQPQEGDHFSLRVMDVIDEDGYYHQAVLVSVTGSDSYQQILQKAVAELKDAYPGDYSGIAQYIERGPTSHLLNRGMADYFALEAVPVTGPGHSYVIAIDGTDNFSIPFEIFFDSVLEAYGY